MKTKLRFLLDEDTRYILENTEWDWSSVANFATFDDAALSYSAEDEEVLSAGQRMERIVLTQDQGSGYNESRVFSPTFNKTGAVILEGRPERIPEVVVKVSKNLSLDDVIRARTKANLQLARIKKSGKGYIVRFE